MQGKIQGIIIALFLTLFLTTTTLRVKAGDCLVGRKIFVSCYEKTDATTGNYSILLANNTFTDVGFNFDYFRMEKEEYVSIDRLTTGETCYLSTVYVTNCSATWFQGISNFRIKGDGDDVRLIFKSLTIDTRFLCETCCLANVNVTFNNNYRIGDVILWLQVTNGIMDVYWSGIAFIYYYTFEEFFHKSGKTSIVEQIGDNWVFVTSFILGLPLGIIFDLKSKKYLNKIG